MRDCTQYIHARRPLYHTAEAIRRGHITIGFIGGSITEPVADGHRWSGKIIDWFVAEFPGLIVDEENAAKGATGSLNAILRVEDDILAYNCDLVFVETAVNDGEKAWGACREGILRKLMKNDVCDVVLTYTYSQAMYETMLAGKLPELAQLAYERYNGERKTRLSAIDAMLDAADSRDGVTKAQIAALLDMDDADYDRADSKLQQQAKDAADRKAAADKKAKEEKAAQEAADKAARSEARRQITLILRNGGTVPNDLWEQSGYSAVTIAAMLRGRKG